MAPARVSYNYKNVGAFALLFLIVLYVAFGPAPNQQALREESALVSVPCSKVPKVPQSASPRKDGRLADGCRHVYLDVGSNIGVQVRKLFEGDRYGDAPMVRRFDRMFGSLETRRKQGTVCAFGFEANPEHIKRLSFIESCYNKQGWRAKFFVPRAVSNVDGEILKVFRDNDDDRQENLGTTVFRNTVWKYKDDRAVDVETIDLGQFIMDHVVGRVIPDGEGTPSVFAKIDIEGAEYMVFPGLLARGAICHIDEATVEWHPNFMQKAADAKNAALATDALKKFLALDETFIGCKPMKIFDGDDESFTSDGVPFPENCGAFSKT